MALSNSTDYNRNRDEIILGALRLIGKSGRGKIAGSDDIGDAAEALELMVKSWQASGIHIWKQKQATLFVEKGTASYSFPGANCTHSYVETAMKVAGSTSDSTIDVDSITGMTTGDFIGIQLDGGTMQWTTINGAPSGDTVTLTTALTGAAAIDNTVYVYTTKIVRPLRVTDARRKDTSDIPIDVESREEYFAQPNKTSSGKVNLVYYDAQLTTGKFYIWPTGDKADDKIEIDLMLPIQDFDATNIDPDFPQEWLKTLKWNLASDIGPEYGVELNRQRYIDKRAERMLKSVSDFDIDPGPVQFTVEM